MQITSPIERGIRFGSSSAAVQRSRDMTTLVPCSESPKHIPRRRDRRQALANLLVALTRALGRADVSLMRGAFEETLRHVVPARSILLREAGSRWIDRKSTRLN